MRRWAAGAAFLILSASVAGYSEQALPKTNVPAPQIAVMDVFSYTYDQGKTRLLTDTFRSEIFKTRLFRIVERGVIQKIIEEQKLKLSGMTVDSDMMQVGKLLNVEKLFVCTIERFSNTIAINTRIVDLATSLIDYTETVFIQDENQLFPAIREIVTKIELYYTTILNKGMLDTDTLADVMQKKWALLGAKDEEQKYLVANKVDPEEYMTLRQYDISFTASEYIKARKAGWDMQTVKSFLQNGISYASTEKAIGLGIFKLDKFYGFQKAGFSFDEFLQAFVNRVPTPEEFSKFKSGYKTDRLKIGAGGVADAFPIFSAPFKLFILNAGWEHFWTSYQRDWFKWSMEAGVYLLNGILPSPYLQANTYYGVYPFYGKLGVGFSTEVFLTGHTAIFGKIGVEVLENWEFEVALIPWHTPANYGKTVVGNVTNDLPVPDQYYVFTISYKF